MKKTPAEIVALWADLSKRAWSASPRVPVAQLTVLVELAQSALAFREENEKLKTRLRSLEIEIEEREEQ